jgi:hypothetical protein
MTVANSLSVWTKGRIVRLALWIVIGLIIGLFLGEKFWRFTPVSWKMNANTLYLLKIGSANEMRQRGDSHGAEAALKSAIQLAPNRYEAYLDLGNLLLSDGETNRAIDNYKLASIYCGRSPTNLLSLDDQIRERAIIAQKIEGLKPFVH